MGSPTLELYNSMQSIYNHFNESLFENKLPQVLLTYQRQNGAMGYFSPNRWVSGDNKKCHEISINPTFVGKSTLIEFMQTLVHEMCHCWQHCFGKPSSNYHNKQWADKMISIGLMPSDTGSPGGAITGQHISDYPVAKGQFIYSCEKMLKEKKFTIPWVDMQAQVARMTDKERLETTVEALNEFDEDIITQLTTRFDSIFGEDAFLDINSHKNKKIKVKYTCPDCRINVWGKPDLRLMCNDCECDLYNNQT